jgi:hypothetical protein
MQFYAKIDYILLDLYGLIGMQFDAIMMVGRDEISETVFQYFELH